MNDVSSQCVELNECFGFLYMHVYIRVIKSMMCTHKVYAHNYYVHGQLSVIKRS